jgi:hypothetical protein
MHNSTRDSARNPFTTIRTEGALLPIDLLQRIVAGDSALGGLDTESYHLAGSEKLNEAINRSWNHLLGAWATFQTARGRLGEGDAGTTLTRDRWLMPLFQELGYGRLQAAKVVTLDGKDYRVSHAWGETPIHLVGCGVNLERRQPGVTGAAKSSPHSLVQEYLNRNPNQLWGMLSNGLTLRVLRDNASLTRSAYLEFDLEAMLTGEVYADFVVLWLVCHQSRVECQEGKPETCRLETWSKAAQEQGTRALDKLRDGVEAAITALGGGFLAHPGNSALKARLRSGELTREGYYRQLLRLVYRLIFLFAAEDRDLLQDPKASPAARERYMKYYSATHLRQLAERSRGGRHPDLYATLRLVSAMLGGREKSGAGPIGLGLPVLGSFLFSNEALPDLESAELENGALLTAVRGLAFILDGNTRRAVDYRNLGTRELGSVYESLLELHPQINMDAGTFELITAAGNERKTTGSYYTAEDLIKVLLDSALDPVILQAIQRAGPSVEAQIAALLALKICDPACGSGHFLIAAARRIARRLAQLRSGDEEPSPETIRTALREAIQHCVYGVDINSMSVELCKVNLWLESIEPGKPLSFLEAHIQCGDSLVGVAPGIDISEIPDEAFNPAFDDDKAISSALKKRNKAERAGQMGLDAFLISNAEDLKAWIAYQAKTLDELPEETAEQVGEKAQNYQEYLTSPQYRRRKLEYDLWTSAFFWNMEAQPGAAGILAPTQEMLRRHRTGGSLSPELAKRVNELAERLNFLHWELRFPKVFIGERPGFDCVLGNPPWERIKLQADEFFAALDPVIAQANAKDRKKLIEDLQFNNLALAKKFSDARHDSDAQSKFCRFSGCYELTAVGDMNTYALFAELVTRIVSTEGQLGVILPSGIATDDTHKLFFQNIIGNKSLVSMYSFDNKDSVFPAVKPSTRFCLMTMVGKRVIGSNTPLFVFYARQVSEIYSAWRQFTLSQSEIKLLNPNTLTCPVFKTKQDAELAKKIYLRIPILNRDNPPENPWNLTIRRIFDMNKPEVLEKCIEGNNLTSVPGYVRMYEAKMMGAFSHREHSYQYLGEKYSLFDLDKNEPFTLASPRFFIASEELKNRLSDLWEKHWLIAWQDVTDVNTMSRTTIACILPIVATDFTLRIGFPKSNPTLGGIAFVANLNCIIFDYLVRQMLGGIHLSDYILKQLPVLSPSFYTDKILNFIVPRVIELVFTSWDIVPFADDIWNEASVALKEKIQQQRIESAERTNSGHKDSIRPDWVKVPNGDCFPYSPFKWDKDRRALLSAELDAVYARLYGLGRDELRFILDPQDVYGPDFPGETFRVLKDKEMRQYGEYRTRRLVLEAWDRLEGVEPAPITVPVPTVAAPTPSLAPVLAKLVVEEKVPQPAPEAQPMLSDFGLYKCGICGKMVMGFEKEGHERDKHGGKSVEWKKMR